MDVLWKWPITLLNAHPECYQTQYLPWIINNGKLLQNTTFTKSVSRESTKIVVQTILFIIIHHDFIIPLLIDAKREEVTRVYINL